MSSSTGWFKTARKSTTAQVGSLTHSRFETASLLSDGHTRLPFYEVAMRSCSHYVIRDSLVAIHSVICFIYKSLSYSLYTIFVHQSFYL